MRFGVFSAPEPSVFTPTNLGLGGGVAGVLAGAVSWFVRARRRRARLDLEEATTQNEEA
jgi:cytochrome c-type biogenesis protein CcmH/NrfF